jgi:catechol 2,3-dioxygenase-like lactoylglutathione lyase family enzyme
MAAVGHSSSTSNTQKDTVNLRKPQEPVSPYRLHHSQEEHMTFSIKPRGVVHFSLAVTDLEVSKKFYTELLGLTFVRHSPAYEMMFLTAGKDFVTLCKSDAPIQPNPEGERRVHHAFALEPGAYEDAKAFLIEKGVEIIDEENRTTGTILGRQFYIHDPDMNVIELNDWAGKEF